LQVPIPLFDPELANVLSPPGCSRKLDLPIVPGVNRNKLRLLATGTVADGRAETTTPWASGTDVLRHAEGRRVVSIPASPARAHGGRTSRVSSCARP
jgi:hypothetical protein